MRHNDRRMEDTGADERYPHRERDAAWVEQARSGDPDAFGRLYDAWFDRCYDVARRVVRDDEVAAEVAQDGFLAAWRNIDNLADAGAFGGWILRITRNQAFNRREREQRSTPFDDAGMAAMSGGAGRTLGTGDSGPAGFGVEDRLSTFDDPARIVEDNEAAALLWGAAEALGERDAEVLNLQLRHGLSPSEVGEVLGMNRNAANQLVHRVRGRLDGAVRARVLWRDGAPACRDLRATLASEGLDAFDADALKLIDRHAKRCDTCDERQRTRVAPSAMFAAIPIAAPILFKQQAAAALTAAGVPMGGSAFGGGTGAAAGAEGAADGGAGTEAGSGADGSGADGGAGGTDGGASGGGTGATTAVLQMPPQPPPPTAVGSPNRTRLLAALGAAAAIILVLGIVLATRSDGEPDELATGPGSTTTTATPETSARSGSAPGSSTSSSSSSTEPTLVLTPSTTVTTTAPTPTTAPSTTATTTATTPTTAPRRITTTIAVDGQSWVERTGGWIYPDEAPKLTWQVTGAEGLTIRVSGPNLGDPNVLISMDPTSATPVPLCPQTAASSFCPPIGTTTTSTYVVEVLDGKTVVGRSSAQLVVKPNPIG